VAYLVAEIPLWFRASGQLDRDGFPQRGQAPLLFGIASLSEDQS